MSLISLVVFLAVAGFVVWLILQIPMPDIFRKVIIGLIVLFLVLWILQQVGFVGPVLKLR